MCGGIALPGTALDGIRAIRVPGEGVVTVENLTTYHDCLEHNCKAEQETIEAARLLRGCE